jgi:hypothetical protein
MIRKRQLTVSTEIGADQLLKVEIICDPQLSFICLDLARVEVEQITQPEPSPEPPSWEDPSPRLQMPNLPANGGRRY